MASSSGKESRKTVPSKASRRAASSLLLPIADFVAGPVYGLILRNLRRLRFVNWPIPRGLARWRRGLRGVLCARGDDAVRDRLLQRLQAAEEGFDLGLRVVAGQLEEGELQLELRVPPALYAA